MDPTDQEETVGSCAEQALRDFQQCFQLSAARHPRDVALVEDQLARFSIWTSSIGVFARGRASMDHRLREAPDVRDAVMALLNSLADSIKYSTSILQDSINFDKETQDSSSSAKEEFEASVKAVAGEITLLYRLSNTIRRAGREVQNLRAAQSYVIRDVEGNSVEPLLQDLYANYIHGRFPSIEDNLCQRLALSMVLRRKRVLYRRSRYGHNPIRTKSTVPQPKIQSLPPKSLNSISTEQIVEIEAPNVKAQPPPSQIQSAARSATTLAPEAYQRVSAPSVISATKTAALTDHEELIFPPPPIGRIRKRFRVLKRQRQEEEKKEISRLGSSFTSTESPPGSPGGSRRGSSTVPEGYDKCVSTVSQIRANFEARLELDWAECIKATPEVICPICLYALPSSSVSEEQKWKSHVTGDLDAYVCLFDNCEQPDKLFSHSSHWLHHMREHTLRWRCNSKSHGTLVFVTEKEYLGHMRQVHPSSFTEQQLVVLASRNGRPAGPIFDLCPICGNSDTDGHLEDHIVGHLRSLALKSLPTYEDEASESSYDNGGSSGASKPVSRATIKDDPDKHVPLDFEDPALESRSDYIFSWAMASRRVAKDNMEATGPTVFPPPTVRSFEDVPDEYTWFTDTLSKSVYDAVFEDVPKEARRHFEWGFLTRATDAQQESLKDDPIIRSIIESTKRRLSQDLLFPLDADTRQTIIGGLVKYVTENVQEADLRRALAAHGELAYFEINREQNCAFVGYKTIEGEDAAVSANPHIVNGEGVVVEPSPRGVAHLARLRLAARLATHRKDKQSPQESVEKLPGDDDHKDARGGLVETSKLSTVPRREVSTGGQGSTKSETVTDNMPLVAQAHDREMRLSGELRTESESNFEGVLEALNTYYGLTKTANEANQPFGGMSLNKRVVYPLSPSRPSPSASPSPPPSPSVSPPPKSLPLNPSSKQSSYGERFTNAFRGLMRRNPRPSASEAVVIDQQYKLKVFNLPLVQQTRLTRISKRIETSKDKTEFWMPAIAWRIIDYLNTKGFDSETLFRVPGNPTAIKAWQRKFDEEHDVDLLQAEVVPGVNVIGSLLKIWLGDLPDQLLPSQAQDRVARECDSDGMSGPPQILKDELSKLSPFKYYLLFALTCHLSLLIANSDKNKLDMQQLAIYVQPCLRLNTPCFQLLVLHWRECWQGCWTERRHIQEEYAIFAEKSPYPVDS